MTKAKDEVTKVVYLLIMRDGTKQKVTVPESWRVTFGPLAPGSKDHGINSSGATSLRFYDGQNQKATFTNVESFRDMSIGIEVEETKIQEETYYRKGENGEEKAVVLEGRQREWVNPDEPRPVPVHRAELPLLLADVSQDAAGSRIRRKK